MTSFTSMSHPTASQLVSLKISQLSVLISAPKAPKSNRKLSNSYNNKTNNNTNLKWPTLLLVLTHFLKLKKSVHLSISSTLINSLKNSPTKLLKSKRPNQLWATTMHNSLKPSKDSRRMENTESSITSSALLVNSPKPSTLTLTPTKPRKSPSGARTIT